MQAYFIRLLRIAIVSTLGFGGGIGLLVFIFIITTKGNEHAAEYGAIAGSLFGILFTALVFCVMMPLDLLLRSFIARGKETEYGSILDNKQIRELTLRGNNKHAHYVGRQALLAVPGVKNVHDNATIGTITASTNASWRSAGEKLEVSVKKKDSGQYILRCTSQPSMKNIVFDYGKNFDNVEIWKNNAKEIMMARFDS